jgi:4'-phosphopantetheinyl transferase
MIRWLIQTVVSHPDLTAGRPPAGLLIAAESAHFATLLTPQRRRDWLVGRWTAKRLVQNQIATMRGFCPALASFAIGYDAQGAPCITSDEAAHTGLPLTLTISHSQGYALCAITATLRGEIGLGVDIELVDEKTAPMLDEFFTPAERANLDATPAHLRPTLATATWSIKEAMFKAIPSTARTNPCDVECLVRPSYHLSKLRFEELLGHVTPQGSLSPTVPERCLRHDSSRLNFHTSTYLGWTPLLVKLSSTLRCHAPVGPLRGWWRVQPNTLRPGTHFVMTLAAFGTNL